MPLFRYENRLVYFVHVPKAAGTAVLNYLSLRFGPLAFYDPKFLDLSVSDRWSNSSPQHMPEAIRHRYLPDAFLDAIFATVRHPAKRLFSAFMFQREIEGTIPVHENFEGWLDNLTERFTDISAVFDGHMRPMVDFVPINAQVFRVEDGLDAVVNWLDQLVGTTNPNLEVTPKNVLRERLLFEKRLFPKDTITLPALEKVAALYNADYLRFGYDLHPPETHSGF